MRIALLGNCQVDPLRHLIYQSTDVRDISVFNFNLLNKEVDQDSLYREIKPFDLVISQVFGKEFGIFEKTEIKKIFPDVILIPNIFYLGWHQDMTYIGNSKSRVKGPTGEYHSLIALLLSEYIFPSNVNVEIFNRTLSYFIQIHNSSELSKKSLENKFDESDLNFHDFQISGIFDSPFMWTMNHPNSHALYNILEQVYKIASINRLNDVNHVLMYSPNTLSVSVNWSPLCLDQMGNLDMRRPRSFYVGKGKFLQTEEFVDYELGVLRKEKANLNLARRPDIPNQIKKILREFIEDTFPNVDKLI